METKKGHGERKTNREFESYRRLHAKIYTSSSLNFTSWVRDKRGDEGIEIKPLFNFVNVGVKRDWVTCST